MPTGPYNAYTEDEPGLMTFTGPNVKPITLTGPVAREYAAGLPPPPPPPAPPMLAQNAPAMTPVGPQASVAPMVPTVSDVPPDLTGGMSGNVSAAPPPAPPPVTADPSLEMSRAPEDPIGAAYAKMQGRAKTDLLTEKVAPPADAGPTATRRFGPGNVPGAAGPPDASGGFLAGYNAELMRRLRQGGGGGKATPAHWQGTTRATSVQDGRVDPGVMGVNLAATQQSGEAADQARQAGDELDAKRIAIEAKIEENVRERAAEREAEAAREKADIRTSMKALIDESEGPDINPGEWWGEQGIGNSILLALSAGALGAINGRAGVKGNAMIESIDQGIERNILAQVKNKEAKAAAKGAKFARLGQVHELARADGADDLTALATAKVVGWSIEQKRLQAEALANDSPQARAKLAVANAAIDQRKADILMADAQRLQTTRQGNEQFIPARAAGGGIDRLKLLKEGAMLNKEFNPTPKPGDDRGTMILGGRIVPLDPTLSPTEAQKGREGASYLHLADQQFAEAERLRGMGIGLADAELQSALKSGSEYFSKAKDMGVVTGGEWEVTKDLYRGVGAAPALKQVRDTIRRQAIAHELQYGADKRGQLSRQGAK